MRRIFLLCLVVGLWLLVACTPGETEDTSVTSTPTLSEQPTQALDPLTPTPEPTIVPTATSTSESANIPDDGSGVMATATIVPNDLLITFTQEGGIMGLQLAITIDARGRVMQDDNLILQLTPEEVSVIYQALLDNNFFAQAPDYKVEDMCCDFFVYTITVHANGETTTARTIGGPPDTPEWLWNSLQPLIAIAGQGPTQ